MRRVDGEKPDPKGTALRDRLARRGRRLPNGCLEWTTGKFSNGYGQISVDGTPKGAHVVAWELANGRSVPPGMQVRHTCDYNPCFEETHLILGTATENNRDKIARGRIAWGEGVPQHKLTKEQVMEIRARGQEESSTVLAQEFGVHHSTIRRIVTHRFWKQLP